MEDSDLNSLRAKRMAQLQNQFQNQGGGHNANSSKEDEERKEAMKEMRHQMLSQILTQAARARLNTLMIAKPEKAQMVENIILSMAQSGQIVSKLDETELIGLLERVNQQSGSQKKTTVKFDRRRAALDDSDED